LVRKYHFLFMYLKSFSRKNLCLIRYKGGAKGNSRTHFGENNHDVIDGRDQFLGTTQSPGKKYDSS